MTYTVNNNAFFASFFMPSRKSSCCVGTMQLFFAAFFYAGRKSWRSKYFERRQKKPAFFPFPSQPGALGYRVFRNNLYFCERFMSSFLIVPGVLKRKKKTIRTVTKVYFIIKFLYWRKLIAEKRCLKIIKKFFLKLSCMIQCHSQW